jgi:hypothetical protein
VGVEDEEKVASGQVPPVMNTVCLDPLMGKQSNWMRNDDEVHGIIAASSKAFPKLSHTKPSLVSLQQQNLITCQIIQPQGLNTPNNKAIQIPCSLVDFHENFGGMYCLHL